MKIGKLRDLRLETDLGRYVIAASSEPRQRELAEKIAAAIKEKTGRAPNLLLVATLDGAVTGRKNAD